MLANILSAALLAWRNRMKTASRWQNILIGLVLFGSLSSTQAETKVVAYVPNWIDLNTFSQNID
jgi:hypothetical protein